MEPAAGRTLDDLLERLLADVVVLPEADQQPALQRLCAAHEELAAELQARYGLYHRLARCSATGEPHAGMSQRFGDYELLRELGRGGMGVVYLARQQRGGQERLVALKLVRDRLLLSPQARERLRREGAAAFRLDHPGICPALDVGEVDGTPYVAMRFVPGRTLAAWIDEARSGSTLPDPVPGQTRERSSSTASSSSGRIRGILLLVEQIARALHAAHELGFVHRDVKPGNIMVTPDGAPVLLDFGLVHDQSSTHGLTLTGQPLGTPTYMPPELIEPQGRPVDRTADVYSLGVTLYEALCGQPPFDGHNREELYRQILDRDAPDPRRRVTGISRDLAVVLATALAKNPSRRYATALALAEDLRRVRLAQPILARPPGMLRRIQLWSQRNPLAAAVLLLLALSQGIIVGLALHAERRTREANKSSAEASAALERAEEDYEAAREAIADVTEVASEYLSLVPWMERTRLELLGRVLEFHRRVLARPAVTMEQRTEAAIAQLQAAYLERELGRNEEAMRLARSTLDTLLEQGTDTPYERRWLVRASLFVAKLEEDRGAVATAEACYRQALAVDSARDLEGDRSQEDLVASSQILRRLAALLESSGRDEPEKFQLLERALVATAGATDVRILIERAAVLRLRGRMRRDRGDHDGAREEFTAACSVLQEVLTRRPQHSAAMATLANTLQSLGLLQAELRQDKEALARHEEARQLLEQLVVAFPSSMVHRINLATVLSNLVVQQRRCGLVDESRPVLERCIALCEELMRGDPASVDHRDRLAAACLNLGNQVRREDHERGIALYQKGLAAVKTNLELSPDDAQQLDLASRLATSLGAALALRQRFDEALPAMALARECSERLLQQPGVTPAMRRTLAITNYNEGSLACETGNPAAALERLRAAVAISSSLWQERPGDERAVALVLSHSVRLAVIAELQDPTAAGDLWRQAAALEPGDARVRATLLRSDSARLDLGTALRGLAADCLRQSDFERAEPLLSRAAELIGESTGLAAMVELLLLARDRAQLFLARDDAAAAAAALGAVGELVTSIRSRTTESPLQMARLRAAGPALEELLRQTGRDDAHAAWRELSAMLPR